METEAVLVDALGTLVELEPPGPRLAATLGLPDDDRLQAAVRAEMTYYRDHAHEAADAASLARLRAQCAALIERELDVPVSAAALMSSIRFRAYPDAAPALDRLRHLGLRLICVSNWDYALGEVLERCGLAARLDGVVTSAAVGRRKPDPEVFATALQLAGCGAEAALHVGDSAAEDIGGARAAGIRALLIDRGGGGDVASLAEIEAHLSP